jgi:hypothetical protein
MDELKRDAQRAALAGHALHHRRSCFYGYARPLRFHRRVPHFHGRLARQQPAAHATAFGLNPANYYQIVAILSVLGVIITAAYICALSTLSFSAITTDDKWHDMRPILPIDKLTLVMFCAILILIGVIPGVIAPIVESGMIPVVNRLNEAQQTMTILDSVQVAVTGFFAWLGGA